MELLEGLAQVGHPCVGLAQEHRQHCRYVGVDWLPSVGVACLGARMVRDSWILGALVERRVPEKMIVGQMEIVLGA